MQRAYKARQIYQVQFMELWSDGSATPHFVSHQAWILEGLAVKLSHSVRNHLEALYSQGQ